MAKDKNAETRGETAEIFIPRRSKNDTQRYVAVNGENMLIQTGKTVTIPLKFAEVLEESFRLDEAAEKYIAAFANG